AAAYPEEPETADSPAAPTPTASAATDPASQPATVRQGKDTAAPAPRFLPLGSGLVLLGLGLAVALAGLRLRRT
ncbi:hypothetical protein GTW73_11220, partial [Streptomyces sp. SID4982]|nr:hypothetical protein [Streptomyces sp. SID4982]